MLAQSSEQLCKYRACILLFTLPKCDSSYKTTYSSQLLSTQTTPTPEPSQLFSTRDKQVQTKAAHGVRKFNTFGRCSILLDQLGNWNEEGEDRAAFKKQTFIWWLAGSFACKLPHSRHPRWCNQTLHVSDCLQTLPLQSTMEHTATAFSLPETRYPNFLTLELLQISPNTISNSLKTWQEIPNCCKEGFKC